MDSTEMLAVVTLGAFRLGRGGTAAPKFKYLDARELLVYLLTTAGEAGAGKSKQEIGTALWGDISDAQLNARFKARMNDVRRVLGGRDWIVFEDETYRFNEARGVQFDAREFEKACGEAEAQARAGSVEGERAALERALGLYRGDFMADYHTRRRKELYDEREWYLRVREELQAKYRRALERLVQLELGLGHADAAVELLKKLVALDEYDDRAHAQLIRTCARQGKRSQALRHYYNLVKQRSDTPPDEGLTALFEKIKRNEPLGESETMPAASVSPLGAEAARIAAPFQVPADLARFVGRGAQLERLVRFARRQLLFG